MSINIWNDRWLPRPFLFRPFIRPQSTTLQQVSDLINIDSGTWNEALLASNFTQEDCLLIKSIPLSIRLPPNRLIWHYDSKGVFSVKSAYGLARDRIVHSPIAASGSSSTNAFSGLWSSIWHANVPGKVKVCLWKACSGILPTRMRLHSRGLPLEESCLFYGVNAESTLHLGRDCSFSKTVLNASPLRAFLPQAIFNFK